VTEPDRGLTAWKAANGIEALWIMKRQRPDLALLDLSMSQSTDSRPCAMSGRSTLRSISSSSPVMGPTKLVNGSRV
jgi:CheY-like chemotaxis protein